MGIILRKFFLIIALILISVCTEKIILAQDTESVLYVPLIGITSVPKPLTLPKGPGNVTYHYAVKNFLKETSLTDVQVADDKCSPVNFTEGDDNNDGKLDFSETWRYSCTIKLFETTQSIATATGIAHNLPAAQKAYSTVIVGSDKVAPLVNIVNITKVAYPLTLPAEGGDITYTYRVNNPGVVPLSQVSVVDDKCKDMSSKLGDKNGNNLLDVSEVWMYVCTAHLTQTTTNTATVTSYANGLKAVGYVVLTVTVETSNPNSVPNLPETGEKNPNIKLTAWGVMLGILVALMVLFTLIRKKE